MKRIRTMQQPDVLLVLYLSSSVMRLMSRLSAVPDVECDSAHVTLGVRDHARSGSGVIYNDQTTSYAHATNAPRSSL